jgi:hypothetical protein
MANDRTPSKSTKNVQIVRMLRPAVLILYVDVEARTLTDGDYCSGMHTLNIDRSFVIERSPTAAPAEVDKFRLRQMDASSSCDL